MPDTANPRVLIVGAGSMGLVTGYHLRLSGADVTYLIREQRKDALARPQILYSYDDNTLKDYSGYAFIADPAEIAGASYDYILIAIDGMALRSEQGREVVKAIGSAVRDTPTKVLIGTIGVALRPWFVEVSGVPEAQVTNAALGIQCYQVRAVTLPLHAPTDAALLARADTAYGHCWDHGFIVDDSASEAAEAFSALYNRSGVSRCVIWPALDFAAGVPPMFAVFAACEIMGWPKADRIDADKELWNLTVDAVKEIQGLGIHGEAGRTAQAQTTGAGLAALWQTWEKNTLPLDLQEFNRYHHGGKVNMQDRHLLADCISVGESEGRPMTALRTLVERVREMRPVA